MKNVKKMIAIALVMVSILIIGGIAINRNLIAKESGLELATDPPIAMPW